MIIQELAILLVEAAVHVCVHQNRQLIPRGCPVSIGSLRVSREDIRSETHVVCPHVSVG